MIDKYAPTLRSHFSSIPALLIHVYRYTLMVYRYTFATANFLIRCTGTHIGCTGTLCPLPLFKQGVPVHINDVPVHFALWCISSCWSSRDFINRLPTSSVLHIGFPDINLCTLMFKIGKTYTSLKHKRN